MSLVLETYDQRMSRDLAFRWEEGDLYFRKENKVHLTLQAITKKLDEMGIKYALVGGMALFAHGYERVTKDVDILVTREDLQRLHDQLEGHGYLPPFQGSKHLIDTDTKVRIEFLTTGEYPGDGKPKDVAFPMPDEVSVPIDGFSVASIESLINMKLASGMTASHRIKVIADVQEMTKVFKLPKDFVHKLHPWVQAKFLEIYPEVNDTED